VAEDGRGEERGEKREERRGVRKRDDMLLKATQQYSQYHELAEFRIHA
jgi:hypothetical protein